MKAPTLRALLWGCRKAADVLAVAVSDCEYCRRRTGPGSPNPTSSKAISPGSSGLGIYGLRFDCGFRGGRGFRGLRVHIPFNFNPSKNPLLYLFNSHTHICVYINCIYIYIYIYVLLVLCAKLTKYHYCHYFLTMQTRPCSQHHLIGSFAVLRASGSGCLFPSPVHETARLRKKLLSTSSCSISPAEIQPNPRNLKE